MVSDVPFNGPLVNTAYAGAGNPTVAAQVVDNARIFSINVSSIIFFSFLFNYELRITSYEFKFNFVDF